MMNSVISLKRAIMPFIMLNVFACLYSYYSMTIRLLEFISIVNMTAVLLYLVFVIIKDQNIKIKIKNKEMKYKAEYMSVILIVLLVQFISILICCFVFNGFGFQSFTEWLLQFAIFDIIIIIAIFLIIIRKMEKKRK